MAAEHGTRVRTLYKLILRLHRNLPEELRILGDNYTREEFKRHKKCKPGEARIFLNEWRDYALSMSRQAAPARAQRRAHEEEQVISSKEVNLNGQGRPSPRFGLDLTPSRILQMTPEQISNLLTLQVNARGDRANELIDAEIDSVDTDTFVKQVQEAKQYIVDVENEEMAKLARGEIKFEDLTFQTTWWLQMFDEAVNLKKKEQAEKMQENDAKDKEKIKQDK